MEMDTTTRWILHYECTVVTAVRYYVNAEQILVDMFWVSYYPPLDVVSQCLVQCTKKFPHKFVRFL